ncbi:hypothetical protein IAU59_000376 [Kwoniella sp. CBS 9459]
MRFSLLALGSLLPLVLSSPSPTEKGTVQVERGWDQHPKCFDLPTRDPDTCECLPGFDEPGYYKRAEGVQPKDVEARGQGGWHQKDCVCPDYPNTYIDYGNGQQGGGGYGGYKRKGGYGHEPECKCKGNHQHYNPDTEKCGCDDGYEPVDDWSYDKRGSKGGHHPKPLKCKPCATPSGGYSHGHGGKKNYKRNPSLHEAVKMREQDERALESVLGCKDEEKACESNGSWTCTDVSSSLWSCGGCPGEGIDCGAVPGASEVKCHQGHCLIDTCRRGYTLNSIPSVEYGTNTTCVSSKDSATDSEKPKSSRFVNQAE